MGTKLTTKRRLQMLDQWERTHSYTADNHRRHTRRVIWNQRREDRAREACQWAGIGFEARWDGSYRNYLWLFSVNGATVEWSPWTADVTYVRRSGERFTLAHVHNCYRVLRYVARMFGNGRLTTMVDRMVIVEVGK